MGKDSPDETHAYSMDHELAKSLAETVIEQFGEMPLAVDRMPLDLGQLTTIIEQTPASNHPQKNAI